MIALRWTEAGETHFSSSSDILPDLLARKDVCVWLDLESPSAEEATLLADPLGFHPLAIEDSQTKHQRPKLEEFEGYFFVVVHDAAFTDHVELVQISAFVREGLVVTVRNGPSVAVDDLISRCTVRGTALARGAGHLLYNLLDSIVDRYFPILDEFDTAIDEVENRILGTQKVSSLDEIFDLKRSLIQIRRLVGPTRDALNLMMTHEFPVIKPEQLPYLRDIADHLIRLYEIVDTQRDLLSAAMETYLSTVNNRLSLVMQRLTIVTVIFLPLTFITGVFGMNFRVSPWQPGWDNGSVFWMVIGALVATALGIIAVFHKRRLL